MWLPGEAERRSRRSLAAASRRRAAICSDFPRFSAETAATSNSARWNRSKSDSPQPLPSRSPSCDPVTFTYRQFMATLLAVVSSNLASNGTNNNPAGRLASRGLSPDEDLPSRVDLRLIIPPDATKSPRAQEPPRQTPRASPSSTPRVAAPDPARGLARTECFRSVLALAAAPHDPDGLRLARLPPVRVPDRWPAVRAAA